MLVKDYYDLMDKYSNESHKNQLIQECSELIQNLTKQRQRELNNEVIEESIKHNFVIELLHVQLIIDYFIYKNPLLLLEMEEELKRLYIKHGGKINANP